MLPATLEAATAKMMRPDSVARELFGDQFVEHYGGTREHEVDQWNQAVTNWEGRSDISRDRNFSDCFSSGEISRARVRGSERK